MKGLVFVLVLLALLAIAVVGVGFLLPAQREGRAETVIAATPARILSVIADVEAQPEWRSGVTSVARSADGWVETTSRDETITFTPEEMTEARIRLHFAGQAYSGTWNAVLVPEGTGTRITVTEAVVVPGPIARILSRLRFVPEAFATTYLAELKARSEGGAGG